MGSFIRLTLERTEGTRIVIEADGHLWRITPSGRSLVRVLSADQMGMLIRSIDALAPRDWKRDRAASAAPATKPGSTSGGLRGSRAGTIALEASSGLYLCSEEAFTERQALANLVNTWAEP